MPMISQLHPDLKQELDESVRQEIKLKKKEARMKYSFNIAGGH